MLETACAANIVEVMAEGEASQYQAMLANEKDGVKLMTWSDDILAKFRAAWGEVVAEEIAANPDSKRVWDSFNKFHDGYKVWGERGYLK